MSAVSDLADHLENPLKAIGYEVLNRHRGIYKVPLLATKVAAEYQKRGGNCGSSEWQEFGMIGIKQWLASKVKRLGYYDTSANGYRPYIGSNRRQLMTGVAYLRQKGQEVYAKADAQERLAELLPDDEATVTPTLFKMFRRELASEEAAE